MSAPLRGATLASARALARIGVDRDLASPPQPLPRRQAGTKLSEQSCQFVRAGELAPEEAQRAWFAELLWRAFPADSMTACSQLAAAELTRLGVPTSERQVRYWLKCEHTAAFTAVNAVLSQVGPEHIFTVVRRRG